MRLNFVRVRMNKKKLVELHGKVLVSNTHYTLNSEFPCEDIIFLEY